MTFYEVWDTEEERLVEVFSSRFATDNYITNHAGNKRMAIRQVERDDDLIEINEGGRTYTINSGRLRGW